MGAARRSSEVLDGRRRLILVFVGPGGRCTKIAEYVPPGPPAAGLAVYSHDRAEVERWAADLRLGLLPDIGPPPEPEDVEPNWARVLSSHLPG